MNYIKTFKNFESLDYKYYNEELNPTFWTDYMLNERIREKLLAIANDFFTEFDYDVNIDDIVLTGSLANYNWNEYSDFDVHIIIDFSTINEDVELVKTAVDGKRAMWNLKHDISIKKHDVELYIQDVNEPHIASGVYSLLYNKWVIKPSYNPPTIDSEDVEFKFKTYQSGIAEIEKYANRELSSEEANMCYQAALEFKRKITNMRKSGLSERGEFSVENLVFKKLRNSGDIEKIIDLIAKFYDMIYSQ